MPPARSRDADPLLWCWLIAAGFLALAWHGLGMPPKIYFDEVHYVKAARLMLLGQRVNPEHPMVAKEAIAAAIRLLGDRPLVWRVPSLIFGMVGLFAFGRFTWLLSHRRFATVVAMLLLATDFAWFIQSRIAMLDMVMAGFGMVALWQFMVATTLPLKAARVRLGICGVCLGLALGAKWSVAPVLLLPALAFLAARIKDHGPHFIDRSDTRPVPGVALFEAAMWLGALPLAVYWASFLPAFLWHPGPVDWEKPLAWHRYMIELQDSVVKLHPYRSRWWQWVIDERSIWYLYEPIDGVQRGIVLIGNPVSMWTGLAGLGWCLWAAIRRQRLDAATFALLYAGCIGMWVWNTKPIQFYYHYLLPGTFLMGCLALALDDVWQRRDRWRWAAPAVLLAAAACFAWFYPIISAAALSEGRKSYVTWMWLRSWR